MKRIYIYKYIQITISYTGTNNAATSVLAILFNFCFKNEKVNKQGLEQNIEPVNPENWDDGLQRIKGHEQNPCMSIDQIV